MVIPPAGLPGCPARGGSGRPRETPACDLGEDHLSVEWQHGQLGRRTANEAVEEQEVFCLLGSQHVPVTLAGGPTKGQPGPDLELRARSRRQRANGADPTPADEEGLLPAGLDPGSDQAALQPAQPLQPAQALENVLERLDAIPQPGCLLVAEVLCQVQEPRSEARQGPTL
jgi:hypothetical protein